LFDENIKNPTKKVGYNFQIFVNND
jgi:hypothetical protein